MAVRERREAGVSIARALGGRLVKTTGDGVLLQFPSIVAAVGCAVLMQKMMAERNAALPVAKRLPDRRQSRRRADRRRRARWLSCL